MYLAKLDPDMDLNEYFDGEHCEALNIGKVHFPTGEIIVADPLYSLPYGGTAAFADVILPGSYPVTIAVMADIRHGDRYMAAKLSITNEDAVRFQLALKPNEDAKTLDGDEIFGYPVETGLASFCDAKTQRSFAEYCKNWASKHPKGNLYDDCFAPFFVESYAAKPKYQREGGDWINWSLPGGEGNLVMFNSGYGDGIYPSYWGYDLSGKICCLVTQFISPGELE